VAALARGERTGLGSCGHRRRSQLCWTAPMAYMDHALTYPLGMGRVEHRNSEGPAAPGIG